MKKVILLGTMTMVLVIPTTAVAATVGGDADVQGGLGLLSIAVEYDGTLSRDLPFASGADIGTSFFDDGSTLDYNDPLPYPGNGYSNAEVTGSNRTFVKGTVGLGSRFDVFVRLGVAHCDTAWLALRREPLFDDQQTEWSGDTGFAWGGGAKACLSGCGGTGVRILADAQYLSYELDATGMVNGLDWAEFDEQLLTDVIGADSADTSYDAELEASEWQAAFYVAWSKGIWTPYGGAKYSDMKVEHEIDYITDTVWGGVPETWIGTVREDFEADNNLGAFVGVALELGNGVSFNAEGRFIDETAISLGLSWRLSE
jgi:hypothetical protein